MRLLSDPSVLILARERLIIYHACGRVAAYNINTIVAADHPHVGLAGRQGGGGGPAAECTVGLNRCIPCLDFLIIAIPVIFAASWCIYSRLLPRPRGLIVHLKTR